MCFTFCSNDVIGSQSKCHGDCDWCDLIGYSVENKMGLGFSSSRTVVHSELLQISLLFQIEYQNDNSEEQCSQNSDKILNWHFRLLRCYSLFITPRLQHIVLNCSVMSLSCTVEK